MARSAGGAWGAGGAGGALQIQRVYRGHVARCAVRVALEELYCSLDEGWRQNGGDDDVGSTRCADEISFEMDGDLLDPPPGGGLVIPKGHELLAVDPRGHESAAGAYSAGLRCTSPP